MPRKRLWTLEELSQLVYGEDERNDGLRELQDFVRDNRIPYVVGPDGILVPLGGFQTMMPNLYDLSL